MALIKSESKGEIRIIFIDEVRLVDTAAIEQCYREIVEVLQKTEESNALLHFGRVAYLSSSALGMLIRLKKKCKEFEISLRLCNISPEIYEVFQITSLDKLFDIHADAAGALDAFKASGKLFFRTRRPTTYDVT
jgi:anti-sigma B factor antagonist